MFSKCFFILRSYLAFFPALRRGARTASEDRHRATQNPARRCESERLRNHRQCLPVNALRKLAKDQKMWVFLCCVGHSCVRRAMLAFCLYECVLCVYVADVHRCIEQAQRLRRPCVQPGFSSFLCGLDVTSERVRCSCRPPPTTELYPQGRDGPREGPAL